VSEATLFLWKRQALIDAGRAEGVKSFEVDELAQAHRTIADLEAELRVRQGRAARRPPARRIELAHTGLRPGRFSRRWGAAASRGRVLPLLLAAVGSEVEDVV